MAFDFCSDSSEVWFIKKSILPRCTYRRLWCRAYSLSPLSIVVQLMHPRRDPRTDGQSFFLLLFHRQKLWDFEHEVVMEKKTGVHSRSDVLSVIFNLSSYYTSVNTNVKVSLLN
ncbi:hypothetical protein AVEN_197466-1 [Araneus ventricosus]|uniref:Uncharacterized protein n=1 Tax=Araneus ventricosus TaxID=182803 RepID=A0A4Y2CHY7_ARAVE|nr:hypothetical protein AVEN_197466-1 [Araneus ventricosus]